MTEEEDKAKAEEKKKVEEQKKLDEEQKAIAAKKAEEIKAGKEGDGKEKKSNIVTRAEIAAAELKEQNEIMTKNIAEVKEMNAEALLNGQSVATPQSGKPETDADYTAKIMAGNKDGKTS